MPYYEASATLTRAMQSGSYDRGIGICGTGISYAMGCEMAERWLEGNWCESFAPERRQRNQDGFAFLQKCEAENA